MNSKGIKILCLEDVEEDAIIIRDQLSAEGLIFHFDHVSNESEFTAKLKSEKFDIILSDFKMPGFDAFDSLKISQKFCPEVSFICVSGSIGEEKAIDLLKSGAVDYVLKDRPERLPYAIKNALENAKEKAARFSAARELKVSETRFRQVAETAQVWIWEVDTNGLYTYTSPVIELLLGYTPDEVVGKKYFYDFFIPEKREELIIAAFEVFAKRENFGDFEKIILHKNGQLVIASTSGSPVFDDDGNFKGYRGVDADITERKKAEESLKSSEEKFRNLFQNHAAVKLILDPQNWNIVEANLAAVEFYGWPVEALQKMNMFQIYTQPPEELWKELEKAKTLKKNHFEFKHYKADGSMVDVEVFISSIMIGDKEYLHSIIHDISERRQVEEKLRKKDMEFRRLSSYLPDLIFQFTRRTDGTYCVPIASDGIKNIFGCTPEEVVNDFGPIARVIHPEDMERVISYIEFSAENLTYFTCEFRVIIPGREIQWISSKSMPEKLSDGSITWYGFNANITDIKIREKELEKMKDAQEILNKHLIDVRENERTAIARDIHDQLGQSLTAIKIDIDWLRKKIDQSTEEGRKLSAMTELVTGTISDVQRISSELRPSILDDIGLAAAFEWYCDEFADRTGLKLEMEIDEVLSADKVTNITLYRILQESLTNIVRHSGAKNVFIRLSGKPALIGLEIADDGKGISEEISESPKSLGIMGMRERVKYAGGNFQISARYGGGTLVIVSIPL